MCHYRQTTCFHSEFLRDYYSQLLVRVDGNDKFYPMRKKHTARGVGVTLTSHMQRPLWHEHAHPHTQGKTMPWTHARKHAETQPLSTERPISDVD